MGLKLLVSSRKMDFGIMSSKAPKTQCNFSHIPLDGFSANPTTLL